MLTFPSASGPSTDSSTPVISNGNGPSSLKQRHSLSDLTLLGTYLLSHTIESSSSVRVTEKKPRVAHCGTAASCARRQTANSCGNSCNVNRGGWDFTLPKSIQGVQ